jgi:hypothetical protein
MSGGRYLKAAFGQTGPIAFFLYRRADHLFDHRFGNLANFRVFGDDVSERTAFAFNNNAAVGPARLCRSAEFL